jgi:hypothetical protein
MAVRTVRLDEDSEELLAGLARDMDLSISAVLKRGLIALRERQEQQQEKAPRAFDVYRQLDLGPGGYALAPSTETRRGVRQVLRRQRG